ncbi:hypothetical protein RSSM_06107 [Rhodopirellula sallentina SM41]|uniref:Uncharacterized protein n=1 Tax=Rhodopirellula sallentina SM41 TaxID=1263870 RepID=M5TTA7_9BACT|nr:hypothetical protein RSSM_06107 [Rhodopirellula sallentina SM41]
MEKQGVEKSWTETARSREITIERGRGDARVVEAMKNLPLRLSDVNNKVTLCGLEKFSRCV